MPTFADNNRTIVSGELAFAASAFEVDSADTARIVGLFGQIPFPGGDGAEGVDGDFHSDRSPLRSLFGKLWSLKKNGGVLQD